jgi:phosphoglucosamine mutase
VSTTEIGAAAKRQLFGTDGIRGVAGQYPLDRRTVEIIGQALGARVVAEHAGATVLLGQDTRESSEWIAEALARGLITAGAKVVEAGTITTPGVAYLARTREFAAGVVISASHNPWQDNGIKIFGHDGYKLSDAIEHQIEAEIFRLLSEQGVASGDRALTGLPPDPAMHAAYVDWLVRQAGAGSLRGLRVLFDCANGATAAMAPEVFRGAGVQATFIHIAPDGRNINRDCGALYPENVAAAVRDANQQGKQFDLGVTFDGDGDRALFSDGEGNVINGDAVLLIAAREMKQHRRLRGNIVVATTMSNMGLEAALRREGIAMLRAPVGDKYVLEKMQSTGATLGGEQSGHIIFGDTDATTGDGMLTAIRVMQVIARSGRSLQELIADLKVFPQTIINIPVREKKPLDKVPAVKAAMEAGERELGHSGRLVVRYSGTETLARVMVEAETEALVKRVAEDVATAIRAALGA